MRKKVKFRRKEWDARNNCEKKLIMWKNKKIVVKLMTIHGC